MRLELKEGINNCTIINDSYNSDLGSLTIALDYLNHQQQHLRKTLILSDILQSGKNNDQLYEEVSNLIEQKSVNLFIGIGQNLISQKHKFKANSEFFLTTGDFLDNFSKDQFGNETILLKGSRTFEFERILKVFEEKVHETVLEINLNAMVDNLNYFRSKLNPGTKITVMVKAFSYGSGSFEIANLLQYNRVDYLAVAFTDEGVALREAGITMPIMVMNPEKSSFGQIIQYQLEPELYSKRVLLQFIDEVEKSGLTNYPIHLKLDTGMHRLGFCKPEIENVISIIKNQEYLQIKSVFSHLAGSEEEQLDAFTDEQIAVFEKWSKEICLAFPYKILRHILNSAGIERFPSAQFDMVRLGIGLYGMSALDQNLVKQVSTLKTVILQIKEINRDETVGYSRKFKAERLTRIGIIPIGYADGLHRILGNGRGMLLVNNHLAPIIGNISMDMAVIDITGLDVSEGDPVVVFGEDYPIKEIATQMGTIPYEVLTSISRRVKRVYFQE
jgi:alanine racemase